MRGFAFVSKGAASLLLAFALGGCNAALGIHAPEDWDGGSGSGSGTTGAGGTMSVRDSGPRREASVGTGTAYAFADWPMPNPPSAGLPNPQSYDIGGTPGVVLDKVTGLEWQQSLDIGTFDWIDADAYCSNLTLAGGGFRLPSRIELLSIVDFTREAPLIDVKAFPYTPGDPFWTASPFVNDESNAWTVHFGFATIFASANPTSRTYNVRCVRKASGKADRYTVQNGTVLDSQTKLTWQREAQNAPLPWTQARDYCTSLVLEGTGWRLPSVSELQTIIDETRSDPAIDPTAFPATEADYFWTSSLVPRFNSFAWTVYFGYGLSTFFDTSLGHRFRCVR
jgi:hypothetical protein